MTMPREVDAEAVRLKAIDIVVLGEGMRTDEFVGALVVASAQSLKSMSPDNLRVLMVQWFTNEVVKTMEGP